MIKKILENDMVAIHFINALHNKKMQLIDDDLWDKLQKSFTEAFSNVEDHHGLDSDSVRRYFTQVTRSLRQSGSVKLDNINADSLKTNFNEITTVVTFAKFKKILGNVYDRILDSSGADPQKHYAPTEDIQYSLQVISSKLDTENFSLHIPKDSTYWVAPNDSKLTDDATLIRDLLGLDHIPINKSEENCYLIALDFSLNEIANKCKAYRPTVFHEPSLRHRSFTKYERENEEKLFYGMTANLNNYDDGVPEIVLKANDDVCLEIMNIRPLGWVKKRHDNAEKHSDFRNILAQKSSATAYESLKSCDINAYFEGL